MSLPQSPASPGPLVHEVMLPRPSTLPSGASLAEARAAFAHDHVHLLLLVDEGDLLRGTLTRADVDVAGDDGDDDRAALDLAVLHGRTVAPDDDALDLRERMGRTGVRRLAVVDDRGHLLGLLCLKRHGRGFCSADDVVARRGAASHP